MNYSRLLELMKKRVFLGKDETEELLQLLAEFVTEWQKSPQGLTNSSSAFAFVSKSEKGQ